MYKSIINLLSVIIYFIKTYKKQEPKALKEGKTHY